MHKDQAFGLIIYLLILNHLMNNNLHMGLLYKINANNRHVHSNVNCNTLKFYNICTPFG